MAASTDPGAELSLPFQWIDFEETPILFSNHFLAQHQPNEFVLTFGQVTGPPVDMAAELPKDFMPLVAEAERRFVHRRATDAVLTTLAERISRGEIHDLISRLPVELHPPLPKGDDLSNGAARRMSLDDFLRRMAEREFLDVSAQLPVESAAIEAHP